MGSFCSLTLTLTSSFSSTRLVTVPSQLMPHSQWRLKQTVAHLKPVLNCGANVCSPNILRTVRRTMIRFLIELSVRPNKVRTVQTLLRSQLACNEMQASARTNLRQTRSRQHDRKCRLKSIYFNHPSQGNSTNYYLILGPRDKAAPPTSQQINGFPLKRVKNLATPSSICISLPPPQESSALSQSEAMFVE